MNDNTYRMFGSWNECCSSIQNDFSPHLIFKIVKNKLYRTIIFPIFLYGFEISSLALREENWLRAFQNEVLRNTLELKREEVTGDWIKLHYSEFRRLFYSANLIFELELTWGDGWDMGHVWGTGEMHIGFWWRNPEVKDHLENLGIIIIITSNLSNDRSKASCKTVPPHSAI